MKLISYLGCLILCMTVFACGVDEMPEPPIEEEIITTLNYTLTSSTGEVVTIQFKDLDGDGGNDPEIGSGTIQAGVQYTGSIELLNESVDPVEDITEEVQEKDLEHQMFYSNTFGATVTYGDMDSAGKPLGLTTNLIADNAGTGNITITLRHEPNKSGANVAEGDITNAGGETDIEVIFPITVE